jgi:hypothetical protein
LTVNATGFDSGVGLSTERARDGAVRCPDFLVAILEIPFEAPVYIRLRNYVSISRLKSSSRVAMAHFKFMLDRGVNHLLDCFPRMRVVSTESFGLRANLPDEDVVAFASDHGHLLVTSN